MSIEREAAASVRLDGETQNVDTIDALSRAARAEAEAAALREVLERHPERLCPMMYGNHDWGLARTKALDSAPLAAAVARVVECAEQAREAAKHYAPDQESAGFQNYIKALADTWNAVDALRREREGK